MSAITDSPRYPELNPDDLVTLTSERENLQLVLSDLRIDGEQLGSYAIPLSLRRIFTISTAAPSTAASLSRAELRLTGAAADSAPRVRS
jgi:hypothetical protein